MKLFMLAIVVIATGCARNGTHDDKHSGNSKDVSIQVQSWVPVGTSQTLAQRVMKQHDFTCCLMTNNSFGADLRKRIFLYCDRRESAGWPVTRRWQVVLFLTDSNVTSVQVTTGLIGP
jgi:hypothetical protein